MSRNVLVDDLDKRISYSPGWFSAVNSYIEQVGNFGPPLKSTLHGTNTSSSFQFPFNGSAIKVYGSNNPVSVATALDPTWQCLLDGVDIGVTKHFRFPENHWVMCENDNVQDGPHILTVNAVSRGQTFWFDYIRYRPSATVSLIDEMVHVPDNDPNIRYGEGWRSLGDVGHYTDVLGATTSFDFVGTGLAWYGLIPVEFSHGPSIGSFSINGSSSTTFVLKGLRAGRPTEYNQRFFETPTLPLGRHTLSVAFQSALGRESTPLTVDYLIVQNGTKSNQDAPMTSSGVDPTFPVPVAASRRAGISGGAIAAITIGVLLLLVFLIVTFITRRQRKRENELEITVPTTGWNAVSPYLAGAGHHRRLSSRERVSTDAPPEQSVDGSLRRFADYWRPSSEASSENHPPSQIQTRQTNLTPHNPEQSETGSGATPSYYGGHQTWGDIKRQEQDVEPQCT